MVTQDSQILGPPSASPEQAIAYIAARGTPYSRQAIATIVDHYWRFASEVGIDPVIALAQCIHETSEKDPASGRWLAIASWWSQRPRRNPAGLGVTGRVDRAERAGAGSVWAFDERTNVWRHGLSFPSWEVSSRAHLGRLLGYALRDDALNEAQRLLLKEALAWRPLPAALRGSAPVPRLLGARHNPTGLGWATPGERYGEKIAEIARAIQAQEV